MPKFNINRFNDTSNNPVQPGNNDCEVPAEKTERFGKLINRFLADSKAPESEAAITLAFTQSFLKQHAVPNETIRAIITRINTLNADTSKSNDISFIEAAVALVSEINKLPDTLLDAFIFELHVQLEHKKNKQKGQSLL